MHRPRDNDQRGAVFPEDVAQHVGDLAQRGARLDGREDAAAPGCRVPRAACAKRAERGARRCVRRASRGTAARRATCARLERRVEAVQRRRRRVRRVVESVHADDDARAALDGALVLEGAPLDLALREARLDRGDHAAQRVDLGDAAPSRAPRSPSVSASTA